MSNVLKISGKKFGKLTAIKPTGEKEKGKIIWEFHCDCGNSIFKPATDIIRKKNPHCGCDGFGPKYKTGKLTILKDTNNRTRGGLVIWLCRCDCGNEKELSSSQLKTMKSCGCETKYKRGEASFNLVLKAYLNGAKGRNLDFDLTIEEFKIITKQDCYYCGCKPSNIMDNKNHTGKYIYNGIDRIDSSKGYTIENCVPCCTQCNRAKSNYSLNEFITWIERVYINLYGKRRVLRAIDSIL